MLQKKSQHFCFSRVKAASPSEVKIQGFLFFKMCGKWKHDAPTSTRHPLGKIANPARFNTSGWKPHFSAWLRFYPTWNGQSYQLRRAKRLLVTPQNTKTTIMQSWLIVLPWVLFLSYAALLTGNTQSSFTGAEIRLKWKVSSSSTIRPFCNESYETSWSRPVSLPWVGLPCSNMTAIKKVV